MADAILTLNAGSSSVKFALFPIDQAHTRIAQGAVEAIGIAPHLTIHTGRELAFERSWPHGTALSHEELLDTIFGWVEDHLGENRLIAAGHRIVHGGTRYVEPMRLDAAALTELAVLNPLAPLHEPHNLAAVRAILRLRPQLPQIGCFDTGFHQTMPALATRFALPRALHDEGVRRYGFHGISYEYIAGQLRGAAPHLAAGRVIAAHLGNGASLCALRNGESIDTSMGFTALDGLVMGTRCGTLDAGAVLYLMQAHGMTAEDISTLLYKKSGLLGISGISADMRELLASRAPEAAEAVAIFARSAAHHAAALTVSLGGLDGLIFTAGIGEHSPEIRAAICGQLAWLGVELAPEANAANAPLISTPGSRVEVRVMPTDEEGMIARHCMKVLRSR